MYLNYSPRWLHWLYPGHTWHKSRSEKKVYLTFDDGPTPDITPRILDILAEYNAKATFFLIGENAQRHPEIVERIIREGHQIGNHTHNHLNGWKTSLADYLANVDLCAATINSRLFRPPYGRIKRNQSRALLEKGYKIIMWDVLSGDFDVNRSPEDCISLVKKYIRPGSIVVFHDSVKAWPRLSETLPAILEELLKKKFNSQVI